MAILIAMVIGVVLCISALSHLANPYFFLSSIYEYQLVGVRSGEVVAIVLPFVELTVALCLMIGIWRKAALLLAASLFLVFGFAQSTAWLSGLLISCGCFGPSGSGTVGVGTILFTFGMYIAASVGYCLHDGPKMFVSESRSLRAGE